MMELLFDSRGTHACILCFAWISYLILSTITKNKEVVFTLWWLSVSSVFHRIKLKNNWTSNFIELRKDMILNILFPLKVFYQSSKDNRSNWVSSICNRFLTKIFSFHQRTLLFWYWFFLLYFHINLSCWLLKYFFLSFLNK